MTSLRDRANTLLEKSGSYLGTDMFYVVKGGFWTGLRFFIGILGSVATVVAFGNLLPRENYGVYSYLLSLGASLSFLTLSGIGPALTRAVARGEESLIPYALKLQLKYNMLAVATVAIVGIYYLGKHNLLFGVSLFFLAFAYPIAEAYHSYEQILSGRKRFDVLTKITIFVTVSSALATVVAILFTDNVLVLIAVYSLASLIPNMLAYKSATRHVTHQHPDTAAENELRRSALHITGAGIIGSIAAYIDKIVLFQVAGPSTLAVYGFAIAGPERLKGLLKNWINIALPRLSERGMQEIRSVFYRRIIYALILGLVLALIYILFAPLLFKLLLPKYLDSVHYSRIYALGLILIPVLIYVGNIFYSQNMLRAIYISSTGIQVLRIVLFLILGWHWGIWGLIAAYLTTQVLSAIYAVWVFEVESRKHI